MTANTAEEHFRLVTETMGDVVWVCTFDMSRLIYVSPSYEQVWGRSVESLYENPRSFTDSIHPDDLARVLSDLQAENEGAPFDHEYRIIRKDGTVRWIWDRGYPVRSATGKVERYVGVARDITDRKRSEREFEALAERFQLVSRATKDAIWDWDIVSNTAWWSEAYFSDLGYDRATVPSYEAWADRIHPEDRHRVLTSFAHVLESRGHAWSEEYRFLMPDGALRQVLDRAYILHDRDAKPIRMVGAMMDVTPHRALEAQLRHAQRLEVIGRLAGGVAHDFNNILQVLVLQTAFLADNSSLHSSLAKPLREIREAVDAAVSLTRQLLVFSRREQVALRTVDLNFIVAGLARLLHRVLGEDLTLQLELAPGALYALADAGMLSQVLLNFAVNARDAMPHGGTLSISSATVDLGDERGRKAGRYACISVRDTGSGIAADVLSHIFEPFFTTKEPERGTGLGLAIASGIVEQHGGFIEVDTEVGRGSVFRVYLPRQSQPSVPASEGVPSAATGGGNETILVVEDDANARRLMRTAIERSGYRVVDAESGPSGLEVWDRERGLIDLVLTDVIMPGGMDGIELANELEARRPGVKVILQTGHGTRVLTHALSGRRRLLHKPVQPEELLRTIRSCLDESPMHAPPASTE